jgi:hypothetical protein
MYVLLLLKFGEWRVFMIGGEAVATIHTVYEEN